MRDIAVTLLFFFLVYYTIRKPFIGVSAWAWITFAFPAGWAWGFSNNFRMNFSVALLTYVSYVFMKNKSKFKIDGISILLFIFWLIALISTLVTDSILVDYSWGKFENFTKLLLFYFAILLIVNKKVHVDTLIWSIVLSISSYAALESFKFLVSGGGHRVAGLSGHMLGDRNDLSVAINMSIPLIIYLISQTKHKLLRTGLIFLAILNVVAIVGTYSRGGFIGLIILAGYFLIKSKRKTLWIIVTIIALSIASSLVPSGWSDRMNSVSTASSQDGSFIGRLWAWKISVKIANNNFFGNSFLASQDPLAWGLYRTEIDDFGPIDTPPIPADKAAKAAHNLYFQVLGDLGYIGLLTYLLIIFILYLRLKKLSQKARLHGYEWCSQLSSMMSVSLIAFMMTGANVSMAYFDLFYILIALSYVIEYKIINLELDKK
ncbi:putative O-glycosylation ligase, exosortase A system-associated [Colwellia psychrerythraea]|uniref:Wzy family polymerase, exosortase system type 1 associated protein n=1 Tax=Colwellia psychrerythraea TaxID=28229 RepID=A0A099L2U8_COLPS|nr:putative O-glycosylation ligase, exosortase A system-associated [Colwellia psychrerythraea]KGJ96780.1 wzy family polymerase, exosortase system type 1 associated protein [Colwellia psychrerythraea]